MNSHPSRAEVIANSPRVRSRPGTDVYPAKRGWLTATAKTRIFPAPSVFQSQFAGAFHQYFAAGFLIPDARNFHDLFTFSANSDMMRGLAQHQFTAPFYAGIGYSLAAWVSRRTQLGKRAAEMLQARVRSEVQQGR